LIDCAITPNKLRLTQLLVGIALTGLALLLRWQAHPGL